MNRSVSSWLSPNSSDSRPGRDVAPDLHLPHPLLGVDVALGEEQVVRACRRDVGDAGLVADDRDAAARGPATWSVPLVCGQRPGRDRRRASPTSATTTTSDDDEQRCASEAPDDPHDGLRPARTAPLRVAGPTSAASRPRAARQRGRIVPRPSAVGPRARSRRRRRGRPARPRGGSTTHPTRAGRGVPARIASPSVAAGSG